MNAAAILVGAPAPAALALLEARLPEWGWALHRAAAVSDLPALVHRLNPAVALVDLSGGLHPADVQRVLQDDLPPVIVLNPDGLPGRVAAVAAGYSAILDYPLDWAELRRWLYTPRGADGGPLTVGPLFGRTPAEAHGTAGLLAHDLKSPISLIISSLEVLTSVYDGAAAEDIMRLLHGSLHAAYRQMYMVSDLIDLTRLELNDYPLERDTLDAALLLRECVAAGRFAFETKGLDVTAALPGAPLPVYADRELLWRAVSAVLDNAVKFTVRGDTLAVSALGHADAVILRFVDSGRPIRRGFEREIMRRAPQWDGRQAGTRTSVALGLPFVHAVAQAHGGSFTAASDLASGLTTFELLLPLDDRAKRHD